MGSQPPTWKLVAFLDHLDGWAEQEKVGTDLQVLVLAWVMSRPDDPYRGVQRAAGFANLWFGAVPSTEDGRGNVVVCSYWIEESTRTVTCNSFATSTSHCDARPPEQSGGRGGEGGMVDVAGPVRALAESSGAAGWVAALPGLVAELEREWGITVGRTYGDATESWVAEATLADGGEAVLKVFVPRPPGDKARYETTVLRLAGGDGCVRLLDADEERGALLLERLGPSLSTLGLPIRRRHEILYDAARRLWRPAPDSGLPTGADKARGLAEQIVTGWTARDRPCSRAAVDQALAAAERRAAAHEDGRAVLLHGDVHQWNTLLAPNDPAGFTLVDPDGLLGEPEIDLGVLMREDLVELMDGDPYERARWLAARTGLDPAAIWDWGLLERLSNGLSCLTGGLEPFGRMSLAAADRIAAA